MTSSPHALSDNHSPTIDASGHRSIDTPIADGIADTIDYLAYHWQEQPSLEHLAARAGWSLSHFQRAFAEHVGVSPKRMLQFLTIAHARDRLKQGASLLETAFDSGLSGPGRLHDLFVSVEAMTPGEYKAQGADIHITYGWGQSVFGPVLLGVTGRGICWLAFAKIDDSAAAEAEFHAEWALSQRIRDDQAVQPILDHALHCWRGKATAPGAASKARLLLRGTNFQLKVWHALLRIPPGELRSYGQIAQAIGAPKATRAVGTACGANLISALIPCHRAITSTGMIHAYRWGIGRKRVLIACELAGHQPAP
ncbi:MAG: methylated-DNA--[protein]-cysteine S-methyltransferase [Pseudomonadota bacterium]